MFLKSIRVQGFRNFSDSTVLFSEGINVIIGHNNAGKTNLLKALSLVMDNKASRKLEIDDFDKTVPLADLRQTPPKVVITVTIAQGKNEDLTGDDLATVAPWLVNLTDPYTATLQYQFFLPVSNLASYQADMAGAPNPKVAWSTIKHNYLRKYVHKVYGGDPSLEHPAELETLSKFDFQFLTAIRDVERDLFSGRNSLLREVIDFFIDFDIKNDATQARPAKIAAITQHKSDFSRDAQTLITALQNRMTGGKAHMLKYATNAGASFMGAKPDFDGTISEAEMYSALRLIIAHQTGIEIPVTHNGLGYNNLIYMSLLLAKMQVDTDHDYLESNAKVFPMLVIEEPEAHLHPSLQYKFLKFLHAKEQQNARQVFITTHSTHITAAVDLDQIICLHRSNAGGISIGYPGKVFGIDAAGQSSKAYVQRFLDATRSDMLFAQNVILTEGLAEQLLLPAFGRCHGRHLEDHHTVVINIGGRYFSHFLQLFNQTKEHTIHKRVACITDRDPSRTSVAPDSDPKACYPFEYDQDANAFTYQRHADNLLQEYSAHPNIRFFSQHETFGKTLEFNLIFDNPLSINLITENVSNKDELRQIQERIRRNAPWAESRTPGLIRRSPENSRILDSLDACGDPNVWTEAVKWKCLLAARYLNSVGKGENALLLANALDQNRVADAPEPFTIPTYITDAIEWSCPI